MCETSGSDVSLTDVPTHRLVNELLTREHFIGAYWCDDDIRERFDDYETEPTDEELDLMWRELDGWLDERMVEAGSEVIDAAVRYLLAERREGR